MKKKTAFYGIGVGPGPQGLIPVAAADALRDADVIYVPKAKSAAVSVARQCLSGLGLDESRFVDVVFNMDPDRAEIASHYEAIATEISEKLKSGKVVAYLTIGDTLTFSTYGYLLEALLKVIPDLQHKTFPGVTSFAAIAAALDWPLGQGKERILVLPCPDDAAQLQHELETHDIVILMKIGHRLSMVRSVLKNLGLEDQCGFGSRIGLPGEVVSRKLEQLEFLESPGYLMTMLIRCKAQAKNDRFELSSTSTITEALAK